MNLKVYENGIIREMTTDEIIEMQQAQMEYESSIPSKPTNDEKLALMLENINTEPTPTEPPKVGYKWELKYSSSAGFVWELVEDPNALGTEGNPLYWKAGMEVQTGHFYTTDGENRYVAVADGTPARENDTDFLEPL